ncbi:MAG: MBL fold metallo-hydrolase [Candidatus Acidiferrum sp.]|jgi:glyoxylase-like metal-dependent hydrolase (beta-lactamase superfamily II)
MMRLGEIEIRHIHGGIFWLDGGSMFGVVPKPLWEKKMPADERNRIPLAANSLLVRAGGKNILVETGNGTKWDAKLRTIYGFAEGDPYGDALAKVGVKPEEIDLVINTHLHFDHAGGNTRLVNGRLAPTFPNAKYVVQRTELEHAMRPTERDRASYYAHDFVPITEAGKWQFVDGDADILPGISVVSMPGHNLSVQGVQIRGGGKTLMLVADLIPTRHHLPLPWIIAYDLYPLTTLETKRKWLGEIVGDGWIVAFGHDPDFPAGTLHERDGKVVCEPVDLNS